LQPQLYTTPQEFIFYKERMPAMIFNCQAVFFSILVCCLITTLPFSYSSLNTLRNFPTKQKKVPLPAFLLPKSHTEAIMYVLQIIVYAEEVKKGMGALKLLQISIWLNFLLTL